MNAAERFVIIFVACLILSHVTIPAGQTVRSTFTLQNDGIHDSGLVLVAARPSLGIKRFTTIKLFGDTLPSSPSPSHSPDVYFEDNDVATFWYVDKDNKRISMQNVSIAPSGTPSAGNPDRAVVLKNVVPGSYLHVDKGANGYLTSIIQNNADNGFPYLSMHNGTGAKSSDSTKKYGWLYASQSVLQGDTFLVMTSIDVETAKLKKVYSGGNTVSVIDEATIFTGKKSADSSLMNCGVAADVNGDIIAICTRGGFGNTKYLEYKLLDRSLATIYSGKLPSPIGDNTFFYYDDAAIVSYADNKFAVATWDPAGVYLHLLKIAGGTVSVTTSKIIDKAGMQFVTIAASGKYMIIACIGDLDGNNVKSVEGVHFKMVNGEPDSAHSITISDPSVPIVINDDYSTAINSSVNDSGLFAVTWRNQLRTAGCVWTYRGIRHSSGFYQSPVESLSTVIDSLVFKPVSVTLFNSGSWKTSGWIRTGITPAACTSANWISLNDPTALSNAKNAADYYQYRTYLSRNTVGVIDSFNTPGISAVTMSWNAQPRFLSIDSMYSGDKALSSVDFGDTVKVVSRRDTSGMLLSCIDPDNGNQITAGASLPAVPQQQILTGGDTERVIFRLDPLPVSDTVYTCTLVVRDQDGWNGVSRLVHLKTNNIVPQYQVSIKQFRGIAGIYDSSEITKDTVFVMQEEDTLHVLYSVTDSNDAVDVRGTVTLLTETGRTVIDSTGPGLVKRVSIIADTIIPRDTLLLDIASSDIDTSVHYRIKSIVNHKPFIKKIIVGPDTLGSGDTAGVVLDDTVRFTIMVHDTDLAFGDTVTYSYKTISATDTVTSIANTEDLMLVPDEHDTIVWFYISDRFGRIDSFVVHCAFPWFETDSTAYPPFDLALDNLIHQFTLIDGSEIIDTVVIPVFNNGRNDLVISELSIGNRRNNWLTMYAVNGEDTILLTGNSPVIKGKWIVKKDSVWNLVVTVSAKKLTGDTMLSDTLSIETNDPRHRKNKFSVNIECNDLPRMVSISPYFEAGIPFRVMAKKAVYRFPPHASIEISFSEPMDTASTAAAVSVYSVKDRLHTGIEAPIPLKLSWLQNATRLSIQPDYQHTSPYFRVKPPSGLFIPTDSIVLVVSSSLHDVAKTPSGPNPLDLNLDLQRDTGTDSAIGLRIDSIGFTVAKIEPAPGTSDIDRDQAITLQFSAPVYVSTIDTACENNRSFSVTSKYNGNKVLSFSSVRADSNSVTFTFNQELFYRDSLTCSYSSRWIRDSLGYATDNDHDGIDATIFDSAAPDDDLVWGYRVRTLSIVSVDPESASVRKEVSPLITLQFDGRLPAGIFDTDTSMRNRSFSIGSGRTGYSSLSKVLFSSDSTAVIIRPRLTFFSNDSVYCHFKGFTDDYRYDQEENLPGTENLFGGFAWHFHSGKIGFYTFPNPYTPNSDNRHCKENGPCGIWFKNLHTLSEEIHEVVIRIYSMNAHPVFDSEKKGIRIRFAADGTGDLPQWKWDTRNNRGDYIATGIYLYTVSNLQGKILVKGKLIIAR